MSAYKTVRNEFSVCEDVIMRGTRLVMPESLRERTLGIAHEGHQGVVRTKQRLCEKVWWPGMDRCVEKPVTECNACQIVGQPPLPEPICSTPLPDKPLREITIDFLGPFSNGENLLVVVDLFSRWPEVALMRTVTTRALINCLDVMFSRHGYPETVISDYGPQLKSREFKEYLDACGVAHRRGTVESMNGTLLKSFKFSASESRDCKADIPKFLFAYRTTRHATTGVSPAELLCGRQFRTKLSQAPVKCDSVDYKLRETDKCQKTRGKDYADRKRRAKHSDISVGDKVLLQENKTDKLTTNFERQPYEVVARNGNSVSIRSRDNVIRCRNVAHMKKFFGTEDSAQTTQSDVDDDLELDVRPRDSQQNPTNVRRSIRRRR